MRHAAHSCMTAIGSNLACAPAQMGNVALWKPSETAMLGRYAIWSATWAHFTSL